MKQDARIYVAGHRGLLGSALSRKLSAFPNLLVRDHAELDLTDHAAVERFFVEERPEYVFLAAARVGGIHDNDSHPADFIRSNLLIATSVLDAAFAAGVRRLLFFGSACAYPKLAPQPMKEEYLLTGDVEPTSRAYAVAKIAGMEMCRSYNRQNGTRFLPVIPATMYGPHDHFDLETSHVLSALIRKFHAAKNSGARTVEVWGTGAARREFLYVDDAADACLRLMDLPEEVLDEILQGPVPFLNLGSGHEVAIKDLASLVQKIVGFRGALVMDPTRPDGARRKLLDSSRIRALGWSPKVDLEQGVRGTYEWYTRVL